MVRMTPAEIEQGRRQWPNGDACTIGFEAAVSEFHAALPGWWYTTGECDVSCHASCGPTKASPDLDLHARDLRFDGGFDADLDQPSTLAEALRDVMEQALAAKATLSGGGA